MISEQFVDICIGACCSTIPPHIRQQKILFDCIEEIMLWYKKEVPEDSRPIEFRDKIDTLSWLAHQRSTSSSFEFDVMLEKLSEGKLTSYIDVLRERHEVFEESRFSEVFKMVLNRSKLCKIITGKSELQQLLSDIDSCSLTDDEEVIKKWEAQLYRAHDDLIKVKKIENIDSATSLDVSADSYASMFTTMMDSVEESQILRTGFKQLESMLVTGGFENRRLYLIGGQSGVGKSAMLINLICNAIENNTTEPAGKANTYLYITAENLIDETWIRFYCCLFKKTHSKVMDTLRKWKTDSGWSRKDDRAEAQRYLNDRYEEVRREVADKLKETNANVIFKYVPSGISTTRDIEAIVDSVSKESGNLRAVFIDYLDLFSSGRNLELRFELAVITQAFKNIAIDYNTPVITATQLNRDGYNPESSPKLTQMGESMEKVNKSDFVLFLQDAAVKIKTIGDITYKLVKMTLLKQRNGRSGDSCTIAMESMKGTESVFTFRFIEVDNPEKIQEEKQNKIKHKGSSFDLGDSVSMDQAHPMFDGARSIIDCQKP